MNARRNPRRLAGIGTVVTIAAAGSFALAVPANAATTATVTVTNGTVTVTGTPVRDLISITMDASHLTVDFGANGSVDADLARSQYRQVQVLAGDGNDSVDVTGTRDVPVTISGGAGNDGIRVFGGFGETGENDAPTVVSGNGDNDNIFLATPGPVTVRAGAGDDRVEGGGAGVGHETISLGSGNDRFLSSLDAFIGARSDVVDGGAGHNALRVDGTVASETVNLSAKAGHLIVDHDARDEILADNIQAVTWFGFGGLEAGRGDQIAVDNLSGTDVTRFTPDFGAPKDVASPNNSADTLTVRGTAAVDHITVSGAGAHITVAGLTPMVTPVLLDSRDTLRIETLAGQDTVDSTGLERGLVQLRVL